MDRMAEIQRLVSERNEVRSQLATVTAELRAVLVAAIEAGELSELGAHKLTGVSRSVVRDWLGKTKT
jgi:transposase